MAGISYNGVELRKLPPRFRLKIAQLLDIQFAWKKLMSSITSENNPDIPKYTSEHIDMIERHGNSTRKLCGEILLDEWSTSGRKRPTVETLLELLQRCELYRAADFVATEILDLPAPSRPFEGPSARIPTSFTDGLSNLNIQSVLPDVNGNSESPFAEILEKLDNRDYQRGNLINFGIDVIERGTENFSEVYSIGSGAFGKVYRMKLGSKGPTLAMKLLHPTSSVAEDQFLTEIRVLSEYRHENLVSLIGFCTNGPQFCLVYEFMSGGSLLEAIASAQNSEKIILEWTKRVLILHGVANGIHFLHSGREKPLIHRDIKSANVLLDVHFAPKIGDFGLAKSLSTSNQSSALTSTIFGTSAYMAPEAFRGDISPKMDVFSFGVVVLEVLTGLPPYDENREGNDIVTYLEESVLDDNIIPFLDAKSVDIDRSQASYIYSVSLKCITDKRKRLTSAQVLKQMEPLMNHNKDCYI